VYHTKGVLNGLMEGESDQDMFDFGIYNRGTKVSRIWLLRLRETEFPSK